MKISGAVKIDFKSIVVKVDGAEIEWSEISYEDRVEYGPDPSDENPELFVIPPAAKIYPSPSHMPKAGGPLIAKRMTSDPFTFRPTDKVWLATSHKPQARTDDRGIWRAARTILLPSKSYAVPVFVMHGTLDIHLATYVMTEWS